MLLWILVCRLCLVTASSEEGVSANSVMDFEDLRNITISEEKRLTQYLLRKLQISGRDGRPIVNMSASTHVEFGLGLIQMDLDERNKILTCSMWSRLQWKDVYLTWNPGDFGGVSVIRLESHHVWIPDIMLYNTADPDSAQRNALVIVMYDGTLRWVPHQIFKSSCSIDVTNFPFDNQACHLWFGSWTHTVSDIDLSLAFDDGIDLTTFTSDYKDSCVWEIINSTAERVLLPEDDPEPVAVLTFTLNFRRKIVFSSYILTLPCVFLVALTLVVFWLPADRPDRIGLAMSLFASFLVLLLILVEAAPPTASSVPVLGVYYCFNMVIIMLSIFLSSLVINIYRAGHDSRPVPRWMHILIIKGLGTVFCRHLKKKHEKCENSTTHQYIQVKTNGSDAYQNGKLTNNRNSPEHKQTCLNPSLYKRTQQSNHTGRLLGAWADDSPQHPGYAQAAGGPVQVNANVQSDADRFNRLVNHLIRVLTVEREALIAEVNQRHRHVTSEWRECGLILDRFFCFVFFIIIVVSLLVLFPRPPGLNL